MPSILTLNMFQTTVCLFAELEHYSSKGVKRFQDFLILRFIDKIFPDNDIVT